MTIHGFYIFDRHCSCIYLREFGKTANSPGSINSNNDSDMAKLLFGMIFSLKNISKKLGEEIDHNQLRSFSTGNYRVHFFETLTNFKFVLVSDLEVDNLQKQLQELHANIFVKTVVFNALSPIEFGENKISNPNFIQKSDAFLKSL